MTKAVAEDSSSRWTLDVLAGKRVPWLILSFALVLFAWKLGSNDLWAPDEPYFAEGAREMLADGHWLVPHINGQVDNHKPPFFFWMIAWAGQLLGGISPLAARLPSAIAALGSVWITMRFGWRDNVVVGRLAAVLLTTMHMFWDKARWAQTDSVLCFFLLATFVLAERLYRHENGRTRESVRDAMLLWLCIAGAFLTKGPIGLVLPAAVLLVLALCERRPLALWRTRPDIGIVILLCVVGTWAWLATERVEGYHALQSVREHFVDRAAQGMHHVQPFWYYGEVWSYTLLPWSFLFPGTLLFAWRRRCEPHTRFLLCWVVVTFGLFSLSTEKRDLYVLPAFPAIALLMAAMLAAYCRSPDKLPIHRRWVLIGFQAAAVIFAIAGVATPIVVSELFPAYSGPALATAVLLIVAATSILLALRRSMMLTIATTTVVAAVTLLGLVSFVYPSLEEGKSGRALAVVVERELGLNRKGRVLGLDLSNVTRSINFYTDGIYLEIAPSAAVALDLFDRDLFSVLVANDRLLRETLAPEKYQELNIVFRTHVNRRDVVVVLPEEVSQVPGPAEKPVFGCR